jgi:hypothetical protein
MKIANVGKGIASLILILSFESIASAWETQYQYGKTNEEKATEIQLTSAVDNSTSAYNEAKEMLEIMEQTKGTDIEKNALYSEAKVLFAELSKQYDATLLKADKCVVKTQNNSCEHEKAHYDVPVVSETLKLSNNVSNLYQKIRVSYCKFLNPNDESCKQIANYQQHMENILNNPQDVINDNVQNIITNTTNGGSCTPTYNNITHSYDCI